MARLTKEHTAIIDRAHRDPKFRLEFLKELVREAIKDDPKLVSKIIKKLEEKK